MELIEIQGTGAEGVVRFNLAHLVGYNEQELWLLGERLDLIPGTAKALDKVLKERCGVAYIRLEADKE